ncbi:hypothetical protein BFW38_01835 [Terasakiispira papahanaumokuakeensis]|uniref:Uncharacterized protein n=1 Tax=Terasakiispira papahanaumokuakeensis TaxID=197479 RepID=A0A1E2V6J0_9GAMM|nr:hypothetical protein BFW38_01835 [Terasakiispira papahanaumokuakeensis]
MVKRLSLLKASNPIHWALQTVALSMIPEYDGAVMAARQVFSGTIWVGSVKGGVLEMNSD